MYNRVWDTGTGTGLSLHKHRQSSWECDPHAHLPPCLQGIKRRELRLIDCEGSTGRDDVF